MVTTVSNPDQGSFSYIVTPQGDGTTRISFLVDASSRLKQGAEYIGVTVTITESLLQNQVLSGLKFEELIRARRGDIMKVIVDANSNLPLAYNRMATVLSGAGLVADIAPIVIDLGTGKIDVRYRSGQTELGVELANVALGVAAGTATRYAVLGSIAIGAALGGPVGAGLGILVGLTAAAGGNVLMIAKQDEIKDYLRRQLDWAYGEVFGGAGASAPPARTGSSAGPNPNLLEAFTQDIVVTAKRVAETGAAVSNRFLLRA